MKVLCAVFSLGLAVIPASASDIQKRRAEETGKKYKVYKAASGRVYRDVTITKITDAGITITHSDGSARLRFENVNAEQRKELGITQEAAEAVYAKEMKARAAYEAQVAANQKERQKAYEERIANQAALLLAAERLEAQRFQKQEVATNIESTFEVPAFPIIRGSDNAILYPIQGYSRPQRNTYYRSGGYGGYRCYPSYYNRGYHHRYSPSYRCPTYYRGSIFNFTFR